MRRIVVLLALAVLPVVASACTGADAQKAEDLLAQSRTAAQSVHSESFTMKVNVDAPGQSANVGAQGGMILEGADAGDFYATMTTAMPGAAPVDVVMVRRGGSLQLRMNGVTRTVPVPTGMQSSAAGAAGFDVNAITPYVKDVSVSTADVAGRTEDEVVGTLDGDALLKSLPGVPAGLLSTVGASLGDIKVRLFIPRDSHLVETALLDMTAHVENQTMHMSMSYAVTSVNKPLTFP
ncbi:MAG TPA: hypothetical protein VF094_09130 [Gaiellaceae bacterium]